MAQSVVFTQEQAKEKLSWIHEGMPVFDKDGNELGTVNDVHYASFSSDLLSNSLEFFRLLFEQQTQLIKNGYFQVDCGVMDHDCFVTPDQIATVNDRGVKLSVAESLLIRS
jgi:hypothetical protein